MLAACPSEDTRAAADALAPPSSGTTAESSRAERTGCTRTGSIEGVEKDPSCIVDSADARDELARPRLVLSLTPDAPTIIPGGLVVLRLTIANPTSEPIAAVFDAAPAGAAAHRDTSLLLGFPDASAAPSPPTLTFVRRTFDSREYDVDQIPMLPGKPGPRTLLRVTIPARASLVKTLEWIALGIPPPFPPFVDDAGRRWVPKTMPKSLEPGAYTVRVDVPLHGAPPGTATVSARIDVKAAR